MKHFKLVCMLMMIVALAVGISACSSEEAGRPSAKAKQEDQAQPAATAEQPSDAAEKSAQSQEPAAGAPAVAQPQDAAQAPGEIVKPEVAEIMGTVLDSGGEIVVFTDKGNFAVTGEDLSDMVGKTVRVLGSLQETEGKPTINVISVYEVK